jgi:hypothetical protein
MKMTLLKKINAIFLMIFLLILLVACGKSIENSAQGENLITVTPTFTKKPTITSTFLPSATPGFFTPTPTLNPTQQIWLSTFTVIKETKQAIEEQAREKEQQEISRFPAACKDSYDFDISPDTKWLATNCGDKTYSILVVQNKEEKKWVLEFEEFLHPSFSEGIPGGLRTIFWDTKDGYLYFTATVGWSGGGDFCFSGGGSLGLFRLNLNTGSFVTLIDRTNRFPGYKIRFSPTGRRYAVDSNGITITDLQTGKVIQINVNHVMELNWSPDGTKLAYSISRCNEEGYVIDSSLYIWDALKNVSRLILRTDRTLLYPNSWDDISRLGITGEEYISEIENTIYTVYEYDITRDELIFVGPYSLLYLR